MAKAPNQTPDQGAPHPPHFVKEWRDHMGWSQEMLADKAGVHPTKIGRVENGKRGLKTHFLHQLAELFGVPASALLEVNPATQEGAQTADLLLAWGKLSAHQRSDVLTMVRSLAPRGPRSDAS